MLVTVTITIHERRPQGRIATTVHKLEINCSGVTYAGGGPGWFDSHPADLATLRDVLVNVGASLVNGMRDIPTPSLLDRRIEVTGQLPTRTTVFFDYADTPFTRVNQPGRSRLAQLVTSVLLDTGAPVEALWDYIQETVIS